MGNQLLIELHEYKQQIDKLAGAPSSESTSRLKQLRREYHDRIHQVAEVGAFLGESEIQYLAERLLGDFPKEAEKLLHRIQTFLRDNS